MKIPYESDYRPQISTHSAASSGRPFNPVKKPICVAIMSALTLSLLLTAPSWASQQSGVSAAGETRPDIIMIVLDDVGFADIGAFGSEITTPNIDRLAAKGIRYNRFDTSAICAPTRAGLLTGRNSQTVNMAELPPKGSNAPSASIPLGAGPSDSGEIPLNAQNVAQSLQNHGYSTLALGKWHLAPEYKDNPERNRPFWPRERGFDAFYGFLSGHTSQYQPALIEDDRPVPVPDKPDYHLSEDLIDHAITAMNTRNKKPKFIYLALGAAHSPLHVPKPYIDAYAGKYDQGWDSLRQQRFERQKTLNIIPANTVLPPREAGDLAWGTLDGQRKRVYARFMETYAAYLTHTDRQIGRLVASLKANGKFDNTLIVFLSDNGAAPEGGADGGFRTAYLDKTPVAEMETHLAEAGGAATDMLYQRPWAWAGNTPFRRYKLWPYLGGVRTPLIVSWPQHLQQPGAIRTQYINVIDVAPTLLEAAGTSFANTLQGQTQIPVAGKSFLKTFNSDLAETRNTQFFQLRGQRAITHGDWRAVALHRLGSAYADDQWQLFHTGRDYSESQDVSALYPEQLKMMKELWWQELTKYSSPVVNDPVAFFYHYNRMEDGFINQPD